MTDSPKSASPLRRSSQSDSENEAELSECEGCSVCKCYWKPNQTLKKDDSPQQEVTSTPKLENSETEIVGEPDCRKEAVENCSDAGDDDSDDGNWEIDHSQPKSVDETGCKLESAVKLGYEDQMKKACVQLRRKLNKLVDLEETLKVDDVSIEIEE